MIVIVNCIEEIHLDSIHLTQEGISLMMYLWKKKLFLWGIREKLVRDCPIGCHKLDFQGDNLVISFLHHKVIEREVGYSIYQCYKVQELMRSLLIDDDR